MFCGFAFFSQVLKLQIQCLPFLTCLPMFCCILQIICRHSGRFCTSTHEGSHKYPFELVRRLLMADAPTVAISIVFYHSMHFALCGSLKSILIHQPYGMQAEICVFHLAWCSILQSTMAKYATASTALKTTAGVNRRVDPQEATVEDWERTRKTSTSSPERFSRKRCTLGGLYLEIY